MVCMGSIADIEIGVDAAGIIKRTGSKATTVKVGDRVAAFCMGTYRNLLRVHESLVSILPAETTLEDGAFLRSIYTIAYHAIHNVANLEHGESILIHSAAGGIYPSICSFPQNTFNYYHTI